MLYNSIYYRKINVTRVRIDNNRMPTTERLRISEIINKLL